MPKRQQWRGVWKLIEEMSELTTELAKLGPFPSGKHPGRDRNLRKTIEEEIADVRAALDYFQAVNKIDVDPKRTSDKRRKFGKWGLTGIADLDQK
jgi:hypothetical protein